MGMYAPMGEVGSTLFFFFFLKNSVDCNSQLTFFFFLKPVKSYLK